MPQKLEDPDVPDRILDAMKATARRALELGYLCALQGKTLEASHEELERILRSKTS